MILEMNEIIIDSTRFAVFSFFVLRSLKWVRRSFFLDNLSKPDTSSLVDHII